MRDRTPGRAIMGPDRHVSPAPMKRPRGGPLRPSAVFFDFYGTLTEHTSASIRRSGTSGVARALGIPVDELFDTISSTFTERATGRCGDMLATMAWVAERCGYHPTDAQLAAACAARSEVEGRYARMLRHDALSTLLHLRRRGLRVAVVSDCTHELPDLWASLPIAPLVDATVFSVFMGERKPHRSLYLAACHRLGIEPSRRDLCRRRGQRRTERSDRRRDPRPTPRHRRCVRCSGLRSRGGLDRSRGPQPHGPDFALGPRW